MADQHGLRVIGFCFGALTLAISIVATFAVVKAGPGLADQNKLVLAAD